MEYSGQEEVAILMFSRFASLMARDHYKREYQVSLPAALIKEMAEKYKDEPAFGVSGVRQHTGAHFNYYTATMYMHRSVEFNCDVANHTNLNYKESCKTGLWRHSERDQ
jgi:hypothetical protein